MVPERTLVDHFDFVDGSGENSLRFPSVEYLLISFDLEQEPILYILRFYICVIEF